jgi:hypothetical protein
VVEVDKEDELLIEAPELASFFEEVEDSPGVGRWQVDSVPQPFGPPGEVIGVQATVKQVAG